MSLPTDHTVLKTSVNIPASQVPALVSGCVAADIAALAKDIAYFFDALAPIARMRFVMMQNKEVWYDRENAALFPKFEALTLPQEKGSNGPINNWKGLRFAGFQFVMMTRQEFNKSFLNGSGNPYLNYNNTYMCFPSESCYIMIGEKRSDGYTFLCKPDGTSSGSWSSYYTIVPICRLNGKNGSAVRLLPRIRSWMDNDLIPEGLSKPQTEKYQELYMICPELQNYLQAESGDSAIRLNEAKFKSDVFSGVFAKRVFGYDFDYRARVKQVLGRNVKVTLSADGAELSGSLLNCDKLRADLLPYSENLLTDINLGHWELYEAADKGDIEADLPREKPWYARPPQMDVAENGTCAIDFGTKSTVVVCRDREARLLRVGRGDLSKAPAAADYENPTVVELRDLEGFIKAYKARAGRPYTQWEQLTVSHQAAEAIFQNDDDSSVYYSVFGELKQWANAKDRRLRLRDRRGKDLELKPYAELPEGDFDPIEVYAYYLGLYINNMHNRIYLDYLLSYPVTYEKKVREHIRQSFERGLRKSLPPAILRDEAMMEMFRVASGASEPAAYAISALEEYGLQPKKNGDIIGKPVAYAVFDFGGGTTDFDFGVEEIPSNGRYKYVIHRFKAGGDHYLGGENILDLMAYEVYQDNLDKMREEDIPIVLPPNCKKFAGAETLVKEQAEASQQAYMNIRRLAREMRCIWEREKDYRAKFEQGDVSLILFSNKLKNGSDKREVSLKIDVDKLENCIKERIRRGVENFFTAMMHAFAGREVYPIHIFLAGNSCKSAFVRPLFDEYIRRYEKEVEAGIHASSGREKSARGIFELHPPLGVEWPETPSESADAAKKPARPGLGKPKAGAPVAEAKSSAEKNKPAENRLAKDFDQLRTGKTGVAFGLLRTRIGGRDVRLFDDDAVKGEIPFPYYLGDIDRDEHFRVRVGLEIPYGRWIQFTYADEPEFELYYTKEAGCLQGGYGPSDVEHLRCRLNGSDVRDDAHVFIRKATPTGIEYAVGLESDFNAGEFKGKIYKKELK